LSLNDTGVILRVKPLADNPFVAGGEEAGRYYAYGIRNSYGFDFDPVTGKLWDAENGEDVFDEINLVEPGFNSGWKSVMGALMHVCLNPIWLISQAHIMLILSSAGLNPED
jgi:hypothetical protein